MNQENTEYSTWKEGDSITPVKDIRNSRGLILSKGHMYVIVEIEDNYVKNSQYSVISVKSPTGKVYRNWYMNRFVKRVEPGYQLSFDF